MTDTHNTKVCSTCNIEKTLDNFSKRKNMRLGVNSYCKQCDSELHKAKRILKGSRPLGSIDKCTNCYSEYIVINSSSKYCKKCSALQKSCKLQYQKEYAAKYSKANMSTIVGRYKKNKYERSRKKKLRSNSPKHLLENRIRSRIHTAFVRQKYTKNSRIFEILGCSWEKLKIHIELQFTDGMTWENRSDWHIDHIIPIASAITEEDVIRLNHYTNLRPLWAKDNLAKGAKMEHLI